MARPPKPRRDYLAEIGTIARILRAVAADEVRDQEWKDRATRLGRDLVRALAEPAPVAADKGE